MTPLEAELKMKELSTKFNKKDYILTAWAIGIMNDALEGKKQ